MWRGQEIINCEWIEMRFHVDLIHWIEIDLDTWILGSCGGKLGCLRYLSYGTDLELYNFSVNVP